MKTKEELHLIILWNNINLDEVESTINERFKVVKKISVPPLEQTFGQEKRLEVLNIIYRFELPTQHLVSVSKARHPMTMFVLLMIIQFTNTKKHLDRKSLLIQIYLI